MESAIQTKSNGIAKKQQMTIIKDEPDTVIGHVYQTTDYSKFKYINGNRDVKKDFNYKGLVKELNKHELMSPIIITRDYYVIDGQHRVAACQELLIPVKYIFTDLPASPSSISSINRTRKRWDWKSTANLYKMLGNDNYGLLLDFAEKYKVEFGTSASLLMFGRMDRQGAWLSDVFFRGDFKEKFLDEAEDFAHYFNSLVNETGSTLFKSKKFLYALDSVMRITGFNKKTFFESVCKYKDLAEPKATTKQYQDMIHEIYITIEGLSPIKSTLDLFNFKQIHTKRNI